MEALSSWIGGVAGLISFVAFVPYIHSTWRRRTRPNRATWWIWTLVGFLLAGSYYASGARHTVWVAVSFALGPLVIAVLSLKRGEGGWTRLDRTCLLGALVSLLLWWFSHSPLIALLFNLIIDMLGAIPTVRKSYLEPQGESLVAWILFLVGNGLNLFAVEVWRFAIVIYPAYMFVLSAVMTLLLLRPHFHFLRK